MSTDTVHITPTEPNLPKPIAPTERRRVIQVRGVVLVPTEDGGYVRMSAAEYRAQSAAPVTPPTEQPVLPVTSAAQQVPQAELTTPQAPRYITLKTVLERAGGFSKSAWHDWSNPASPRYDPTIPRSVRLSVTGRGCVRWVEAEVDAWLAAKAVAGRKQYAAPGTKTVAARKKGTTSSKVNAAQCTESASVVAKLVDA